MGGWLGAIEKPPNLAVPVVLGTPGTTGGGRTNADGQVLHVLGNSIAGLYVAGNVVAGTTGPDIQAQAAQSALE